MLGIPLAPVPPKPERYVPLRFRPRVERPEPTGPTERVAPVNEDLMRVTHQVERAEWRFAAKSAKRYAAEREGERTRRTRTPGQQMHLDMLERYAAMGHKWAKEELRKLKTSCF